MFFYLTTFLPFGLFATGSSTDESSSVSQTISRSDSESSISDNPRLSSSELYIKTS